jgi:oligopeptide/dipeptide ABC transporter ATP-binding protein
MAVLLILTHDLGVVAHFAERVEVMYGGKIVERGSVRDIFKRPAHPSHAGPARRLAGPVEPAQRWKLSGPGALPHHAARRCPFCARCKYAYEPCPTVPPRCTRWGKDTARLACCTVPSKRAPPNRRARADMLSCASFRCVQPRQRS